jgi:hypothetical protein
MSLFIKILSAVAFFGSITWLIKQPDYEPAIAVVTSMSAFLGAWFLEKKSKPAISLKQSVSKNAVGIQAGGNVNIDSIKINKK